MTKANGTEVPLEPSERDPCMDPPGSGAEPNVFVRFRGEVCERWALTQQVFYVFLGLVIGVVLLSVVVIVLGAAWPYVPHSQRFPVCKESACLQAAAQVREAMQSNSSPCSDLWTWACGGWLKSHPLPHDRSLWNQKQQLAQQGAARTRDLITTLKLPLHVNSVEWKLKYLYEACMNIDSINAEEARPLTTIISELGGWYVLGDWTQVDFDRAQLLKQLQVKYGVDPFFKISVETDPYSPEQNIIRVSPSGLGLPDKEYYYKDQDDRIQIAYKELIRDVVRTLGATRNEAEKFSHDIFSYEKRLAEITPSLQLLENPIQTSDHISISELKETVLTIPFDDILTDMFRAVDISETTQVLVTSQEYLLQISHIISSTDSRTINGYLIWTFVRRYLPYVSESLTAALNSFHAELFGVREPLQRWENCANLVHNFMGLAVNYLEETHSPNTTETTKVVNETYAAIWSVVKTRINKIPNSYDLHNQLNQKLSQISLQIGLPERVKSNYLKDYYRKLKIIKASLFQSVQYGMDFRRHLLEQRLLKWELESNIINHLEVEPPMVTYSRADNLVVIPSTLLRYPFYERNYPRSILYGRLGVEIASAILSSVLPYDSFWSGNKKLLSLHSTTNESLNSISTQQRCLAKYILNLNLALPTELANETALNTLKQIAAISVANQALTLSSAKKKHVHQPALEEYEDTALFFLTYAQTQCSESTNQFQEFDTLVNFKLPQRSLLHVIWAQLPEFSESVGCSYDKKSQCAHVV